MKKVLPLMMAGVMALTSIPAVFADTDINDYSVGTKISYECTTSEEYTVKVPAKLTPGTGGVVTLEGAWPSDKTVSVTADSRVTLVNSINSGDTTTLNITFDGINLPGNNYERVIATANVSVTDISGALFGTWSGTFYYNVEGFVDETDGVQFEKKYVRIYDNPDDTFLPEDWVIFHADGSSTTVDSTSSPGQWINVVNDGTKLTWFYGDNLVAIYEVEDTSVAAGYRIRERYNSGGALEYAVENNQVVIKATDIFYNDFGGRDVFWQLAPTLDLGIMRTNFSEGELFVPVDNMVLDMDTDTIRFDYVKDSIYGIYLGEDVLLFSVQELPITNPYLNKNQPYELTYVKDGYQNTFADKIVFAADGKATCTYGDTSNSQEYFVCEQMLLLGWDYMYVLSPDGNTMEVIYEFGEEEIYAIYTISDN